MEDQKEKQFQDWCNEPYQATIDATESNLHGGETRYHTHKVGMTRRQYYELEMAKAAIIAKNPFSEVIESAEYLLRIQFERDVMK